MIDFILDYKKKEAEEKGIDFIINADAVYTNKIRNEDICIILANLLDNAIEAAREHKGPKRWIHVTIRKIGDLLLFKIQNSIGHGPGQKREIPALNQRECGPAWHRTEKCPGDSRKILWGIAIFV